MKGSYSFAGTRAEMRACALLLLNELQRCRCMNHIVTSSVVVGAIASTVSRYSAT